MSPISDTNLHQIRLRPKIWKKTITYKINDYWYHIQTTNDSDSLNLYQHTIWLDLTSFTCAHTGSTFAFLHKTCFLHTKNETKIIQLKYYTVQIFNWIVYIMITNKFINLKCIFYSRQYQCNGCKWQCTITWYWCLTNWKLTLMFYNNASLTVKQIFKEHRRFLT